MKKKKLIATVLSASMLVGLLVTAAAAQIRLKAPLAAVKPPRLRARPLPPRTT
ncbi:hypothetical protein M5E87_07810 [Flavonifractor plautii]|nr:hypothetical protein M5E87_07810 [Flavonifractor plautii]